MGFFSWLTGKSSPKKEEVTEKTWYFCRYQCLEEEAEKEDCFNSEKCTKCIDRGSYYEFIPPLSGTIRMLEKIDSRKQVKLTWFKAGKYASNLRKGGFDDWRLPTKEESIDIYKKFFWCDRKGLIDHTKALFWSSTCNTPRQPEYIFVYNYIDDDYWGPIDNPAAPNKKDLQVMYPNKGEAEWFDLNVRCVR